MPEGSETDERLETPHPRRRDMDSRFLAGCLTIAVLSVAYYAMLAWPLFAFPVHERGGLGMVGLFGALPVLVVGAALVRVLGLEGATALAGGSFAGAIFAYLRIDSLMLGKLGRVEDLPAPEYPGFWAWLVPLGWCLAVSAVILLLLPKRETQDEGGAGPRR